MTDGPNVPENPIFCAIDMADLERAHGLVAAVVPHIGGIKLGLEFFSAQGPNGIRSMARHGLPIFLDVKLHDIPNTVAGAVAALSPLGVRMITLHASGGAAMAQAAREAAQQGAEASGAGRARLIGVTVLTSLDDQDLAAHGVAGGAEAQVLRMGRLAASAGLDGLVCSPWELPAVRAAHPRPFTLVVPGVRPAGVSSNDQKRVMTPREAVLAGADVLVVGRPITAAPDPALAAAAIADEVMLARGEAH